MSKLNFRPDQSYASRAINMYNAEPRAIDVNMYRITQQAHSDAMIAASNRGVRVRIITEPDEYRNSKRLWDARNVDLMWKAGITTTSSSAPARRRRSTRRISASARARRRPITSGSRFRRCRRGGRITGRSCRRRRRGRRGMGRSGVSRRSKNKGFGPHDATSRAGPFRPAVRRSRVQKDPAYTLLNRVRSLA